MADTRAGELLASARSTSVRHVVLALTLALAGVVYLDRVAISTTRLAIEKRAGPRRRAAGARLQRVHAGLRAVRGAERLAGRPLTARASMLTRIVVGWSMMTAATGWAWSFASLCLIRFAFGIGEAGAFPSIARVYGRWLPARQRGRAFGLTVMCGLLASAATQPLVVALMGVLSWRAGVPALRPGGARLGPRLVLLVSRRPARSPARRPRRAGDHRQRARADARARALAAAAREPQPAGAVRDVPGHDLRLVLLPLVAAAVPRCGRAASISGRSAGSPRCRSSASPRVC